MPKVVICVVPGLGRRRRAQPARRVRPHAGQRRARPVQADRRRRGQLRRRLRLGLPGPPGRPEVRPRDLLPRHGVLGRRRTTAWARSTPSSPTPSSRPSPLEWAAAINAKSPTAQRMLKYAFNLIDDGLVGQQLFAGEATRLAYGTDEAAEGRDAFLEKRAAELGRSAVSLLTHSGSHARHPPDLVVVDDPGDPRLAGFALGDRRLRHAGSGISPALFLAEGDLVVERAFERGCSAERPSSSTRERVPAIAHRLGVVVYAAGPDVRRAVTGMDGSNPSSPCSSDRRPAPSPLSPTPRRGSSWSRPSTTRPTICRPSSATPPPSAGTGCCLDGEAPYPLARRSLRVAMGTARLPQPAPTGRSSPAVMPSSAVRCGHLRMGHARRSDPASTDVAPAGPVRRRRRRRARAGSSASDARRVAGSGCGIPLAAGRRPAQRGGGHGDRLPRLRRRAADLVAGARWPWNRCELLHADDLHRSGRLRQAVGGFGSQRWLLARRQRGQTRSPRARADDAGAAPRWCPRRSRGSWRRGSGGTTTVSSMNP